VPFLCFVQPRAAPAIHLQASEILLNGWVGGAARLFRVSRASRGLVEAVETPPADGVQPVHERPHGLVVEPVGRDDAGHFERALLHHIQEDRPRLVPVGHRFSSVLPLPSA